MLLNGKPFSGSKRAIQLAQHLRVIAGNATWFSTLDPVNNPFPNETYLLLRELFEARLCFFLTGSFVYYTAGIFQGYSGASLFIALTDTPLTRLLFQLDGNEIETFWLGGFEFHLLESEPEADLFIYTITKGEFHLQGTVFGVDVSEPTGVLGSVDLIHFVWNNFESSYHKRYAITVILSDITDGHPTLLLHKYMAGADGWKDNTGCPLCDSEFRDVTRRQTFCQLPGACACKVCVRQPPKLFDLALRVYSKMVYDLEHFEVTHNTTHDQYVYASTSERVLYFRLLPPGYPNPILSFRFSTMDTRFDTHCSGSGSWEGTVRRNFRTIDGAVRDLALYKHTYWCHYCDKGLFFPVTCPVFAHRHGLLAQMNPCPPPPLILPDCTVSADPRWPATPLHPYPRRLCLSYHTARRHRFQIGCDCLRELTVGTPLSLS
jgi:hypothetical protein